MELRQSIMRESEVSFHYSRKSIYEGGGGSNITRLGSDCGWLLPIQRIMIVRGIVGRYDTLSRCVLLVA